MAETKGSLVPAASLQDVVLVMDVPVGTWTAYIHRWTGDVVTITESDLVLEDPGPENWDLVEYMRESVASARAVVESEDYLVLPGRFEIREYDIMERFIAVMQDRSLKEELHRAIRGRRAFRCFRDVVRGRGLLEPWFLFRQHAVEEIAARWLEANRIAYRRP